jgi:hypothetical protein
MLVLSPEVRTAVMLVLSPEVRTAVMLVLSPEVRTAVMLVLSPHNPKHKLVFLHAVRMSTFTPCQLTAFQPHVLHTFTFFRVAFRVKWMNSVKFA